MLQLNWVPFRSLSEYTLLRWSSLALVQNSLSHFHHSSLQNKSLAMSSKFKSLLGKWKKKKEHSLLSYDHPTSQKVSQSPHCIQRIHWSSHLAETVMEGGQISARKEGIHQVVWKIGLETTCVPIIGCLHNQIYMSLLPMALTYTWETWSGYSHKQLPGYQDTLTDDFGGVTSHPQTSKPIK